MPQSRPTKPATIYEIAVKAGVSSSTVARVLRGEVKETWPSTARRAERIRKLADEMGYRTNWRARAFSERRTWTIGLFYTRGLKVVDGVYADIVTGLNFALQQRGYNLMLIPVESKQFEDIVLGSRLDGCTTMESLPESARALLQKSQLPGVILNSDEDPTLPGVLIDDYGGGYAAAKHLLELGHRRIGFYINIEAQNHYSIEQRRFGAEAAMRDAGLDYGVDFFHVDDKSIKGILSDPQRRPPAMICYSHFEAIPVLSHMYSLGLRVPDVMSVVGFNENGPAVSMCPPLTTVSYDGQRMGKIAAQLLLRRIDGGIQSKPQTLTLKHRLTVRDSTGSIETAAGG